MPTPGRKPTPTALKLLKGTRKDRVNQNEITTPVGLPTAPAFLDSEARAEWDRMIALVGPSGILTPLDGPALANYCTLFSLARRAQEDVDSQGPVAATQMGAPKPNPAVQVLLSATAQMDKLLAEFGMTPSARSRISAPPEAPKDEFGEFLNRKRAR